MPQWSDDDVTGGEGGTASASRSREGSLSLDAMADEGGASADRGSVSAENLLEGGDATGGGELVDHDDFTDEEADTAVEDLAEAGTVVALMKAVAAVDCPAMKRLLKRADAIGCQDEVCLPPIKGSQSNIFFLAEREREREKKRKVAVRSLHGSY
jgi:hypothetical protein